MTKRSTHDEQGKRHPVSIQSEALFAVEKKVYLKQIEELKRAEKINRVLFRISNAVNTASDLDQLYFSIHQTLSQIIDVSNFYIALYDSQNRTLRFPYYQDEMEKGPEDLVVDYDTSDSLTGQVIIDGKPVFLNQEALLERNSQNRLVGAIPLVWLGAPLIADEKVIGVMAVQSYTNPHLFEEKDIDILASVSDQVALAIDRKRAEKERDKLISELQKTLAEVNLKGDHSHLRVL
jgi:two-component system, cell cycle sensor histidine kinase and response regulator CckA